MTEYTTTALIGLDIGKNVHEVGVYAAADLSSMQPTLTLHNNRSGFALLAGTIQRLLERQMQVHVGNEPTGVYYQAFGRELQTRFADELASGRLRYSLVNPHLVKLSRTALQRGRARKSDPIDTQAIARCLQLGQVLLARFATGDALLFEQWSRRYRRNERDKRTLGNGIIRQMDQLWPGAFVNLKRFQKAHPQIEPPQPLVQTRPLERKLVQAILTHCPNPYDVLAFTVEEMVEFLREYIGRGGVKTARKVLRNAREALLPPPAVAAIYAQNLSDDWRDYRRLLAREAALIQQADVLVPRTPAALLLGVPGISAYHAARYYASVGDIRRFPSAAQVWSYAGFDPAFFRSGDATRSGQISKRGDPAFRDCLYLIGQSTARHCEPIRRAFQRCYRGDKRRRVLATIHAAHKANRLLVALLRDEAFYDPRKHV